MSIYFVYRSHYNTPKLNLVKKFETASILDWFKQNWHVADSEAALGCAPYGFDSLYCAIDKKKIAPPETNEDLRKILDEHLYVEGEILFEPKFIQVLTDDDELEMAYYFVDSSYLAEHAAKASFLVHDDWKLPSTFGDQPFHSSERTRLLSPKGNSQGSTYCAFLSYYDSSSLSDLIGAKRIDGVRIPDLARHLTTASAPATEPQCDGWPFELLMIRSQILADPNGVEPEEEKFLEALRDNPEDDPQWNAYEEWLKERDSRHIGIVLLERAMKSSAAFPVSVITNSVNYIGFGSNEISKAQAELEKLLEQVRDRETWPDKAMAQVEEHVAQVSIQTADWGEPLYQRWILFDDMWASANGELANSILRYADRWDVLSN